MARLSNTTTVICAWQACWITPFNAVGDAASITIAFQPSRIRFWIWLACSGAELLEFTTFALATMCLSIACLLAVSQVFSICWRQVLPA